MFESLTIEGYRCFDRFEIPELRRVNLLVGRNNAGKSTILEVVGLLTSGGDVRDLLIVAPGRSEVRLSDEGDTWEISVGSLFHMLNGVPRDRLELSAGVAAKKLKVSIELLAPDARSRKGGREPIFPATYISALKLTRSGHAPGSVTLKTRSGVARIRADEMPYITWCRDIPGFRNLAYVPPTRESVETLQATWDEIAGNPQEDRVLEVLRVIEPGLERIIFAGTNEPAIYARFRDTTQRVPFGSLGEGAWRLLQIGIYLAWNKAHLLLLDEIDTGLHWSAMVPVWKMILTLAKQSKVQVFATTHSDDCIRALAELHEQDPEITQDFMLHYISRDEPRARSFTAAEVATAVEHKVELRG